MMLASIFCLVFTNLMLAALLYLSQRREEKLIKLLMSRNYHDYAMSESRLREKPKEPTIIQDLDNIEDFATIGIA